METRKITIVSTKNQTRSTIMSAATTLAELKSDLRSNHIDYTDMTFYEGVSRTELVDDASFLPHDVPYKGTTTNELVIMLTNPNKKIKSGAVDPTRNALYNEIVARHLEAACMERYGRNYTNCKNSELMALIEDNQVEDTTSDPVMDEGARAAIRQLVGILYDEDLIGYTAKDSVLNCLNTTPAIESPYSEDELNEMLDGRN